MTPPATNLHLGLLPLVPPNHSIQWCVEDEQHRRGVAFSAWYASCCSLNEVIRQMTRSELDLVCRSVSACMDAAWRHVVSSGYYTRRRLAAMSGGVVASLIGLVGSSGTAPSIGRRACTTQIRCRSKLQIHRDAGGQAGCPMMQTNCFIHQVVGPWNSVCLPHLPITERSRSSSCTAMAADLSPTMTETPPHHGPGRLLATHTCIPCWGRLRGREKDASTLQTRFDH
jgi:hypothetical protein